MKMASGLAAANRDTTVAPGMARRQAAAGPNRAVLLPVPLDGQESRRPDRRRRLVGRLLEHPRDRSSVVARLAAAALSVAVA